MSISTWEKEFYGPLRKAAKSDRAALEHGIRKWTGLLPKNLERHGMYFDGGDITDGVKGFWIDDSTCALCQRYHRRCSACPIYPCCSRVKSPYGIWITTGNPRPMIRNLDAALKKLETNDSGKKE